MCAPDPNAGARRAAQERQNFKIAKHASDSIKYWNRETTYKRGREAIAMGFSRSKSDAYVKALNIISEGRKSSENLQRAYSTERYVDEGGRGRRAGKNILNKLLANQAQIDKASNEAVGRNYDILMQGVTRDYVSRQAKNRTTLGVKPEWGAPVMMPPVDRKGQFLATLSTGLSIATSAFSIASGIGGFMSAAGTAGAAPTLGQRFANMR